VAQLKSHEVEAWLKRPDTARFAVFLVYGPDRGLVAERAAHLATALGSAADDPFSTIRLEAADLDRDGGRLIDEARTISMFGDRRLVWVRRAGAQKGLAEAVRILAEDPPVDAAVIVEADELRKSAPLRTAVESSPRALALPCYADEGRALDQLIDETLSRSGLTISADARSALRDRLGGDRLASRSELDKLALYCMGTNAIGLADVETVCGDVSQLSVDSAVDALFEGRPRDFEDAMARLSATGGSMQTVLIAAQRMLQQLHLLRSTMQVSRISASAAVAGARPPLFGNRRRQVERLLQALDTERLAESSGRVFQLIFDSRRNARLAEPLVRRGLLALCLEFGRRLGT
jgi:DNA polymerase III subunit delta